MQVTYKRRKRRKEMKVGRNSLGSAALRKPQIDKWGSRSARCLLEKYPLGQDYSGSAAEGMAADSHQLITLLAGGSLLKRDLRGMPPCQPHGTCYQNTQENCCCYSYSYSP